MLTEVGKHHILKLMHWNFSWVQVTKIKIKTFKKCFNTVIDLWHHTSPSNRWLLMYLSVHQWKWECFIQGSLLTAQWQLLGIFFCSVARNDYLSAQWQLSVDCLLMIGDILYSSTSVKAAPPKQIIHMVKETQPTFGGFRTHSHHLGIF